MFYANGQKAWERQHQKDRKEGYFRRWDEAGRLTEERWYHLNELHGLWREWNEAGEEEVIGDFCLGYERESFANTVNADFCAYIKPHYELAPGDFAVRLDAMLRDIRRSSIRLAKSPLQSNRDLTVRGSFWNHVNILGEHETWPNWQGAFLHPILQINCDEVSLPDNPLAEFAFVTLFATSSGHEEFGQDLVVRAYRHDAELISVVPPVESLDAPCGLSLSKSILSYPDENDLPPGLKVYLNESGEHEQVLNQEEKLRSRLGGWPGWLQNGRLAYFGKFAFQVDSLDVENWDCGDCTIQYFFLNEAENEFTWVPEMC